VNPPFLLDTNTCVAYLRQNNVHVLNRMQTRQPDELRLCSIVVAELHYGAFKSKQLSKNSVLLATFLPAFLSLPFDDLSAIVYGQIRADLEAKGTPIGPNDLMIASIALSNDLTLVTHNTSEFGRVSGLRLIDWHVP
jgi:tRNA(fMet)-specific endonuclease VapC